MYSNSYDLIQWQESSNNKINQSIHQSTLVRLQKLSSAKIGGEVGQTKYLADIWTKLDKTKQLVGDNVTSNFNIRKSLSFMQIPNFFCHGMGCIIGDLYIENSFVQVFFLVPYAGFEPPRCAFTAYGRVKFQWIKLYSSANIQVWCTASLLSTKSYSTVIDMQNTSPISSKCSWIMFKRVFKCGVELWLRNCFSVRRFCGSKYQRRSELRMKLFGGQFCGHEIWRFDYTNVNSRHVITWKDHCISNGGTLTL